MVFLPLLSPRATAKRAGNGIINASGDLWKAQRKAGLKFFSGNNLEIMVDEVLPEAYSRIRQRLLEHADNGTVVDMQLIFLDFTSFIMGHMAYDVRSRSEAHQFGILMLTDGP